VDPFAVIVDGDCQFFLGGFLPYDVLIQVLLDFERLGDLMRETGRLVNLIVV